MEYHPPVYLGVVAIEKGALGLPVTKVVNFTFFMSNHKETIKKIRIYIYIYMRKKDFYFSDRTRCTQVENWKKAHTQKNYIIHKSSLSLSRKSLGSIGSRVLTK